MFNFTKKGDLRNDNDPNLTYEGENNVLIQQASNFLISVRGKGWNAFENASPLGTAAFLKNGERILGLLKCNWSCVGDALNPDSELVLFQKFLNLNS